jgi:cytochrome c
VADNQGDWLPSSKIVHVRDGAWFGSRSVDPEGTKDKKEDLPLVWLPQDEIGNSPSTPLALDLGPYKGQMIHGEVTHGGVKRVFVEEINGQLQGCVFRFIQGLEAGVNRLQWGPDDASVRGRYRQSRQLGTNRETPLTVCKDLVFNNQAHLRNAGCQSQVQWDGNRIYRAPAGWGRLEYLTTYEVKQWYYKPTIEYGGPKLDEKKLTVKVSHRI